MVESITVINNVGIQLSTRYLFAKPSIVFVPFSNIQNIVINEAIVMFQVRYYLAIVVKDSPKLLVVFQVFCSFASHPSMSSTR